MDNLFQSKWFVLVISLAFAVLLFVFVNVEISDKSAKHRFFGTSDDTETVDGIPVDIKIDKNNVVSGVPKNATVSLEGPKSKVAPIAKQRNIDVYVDLRGKGEGKHKVKLQYGDLPDDVNAFIEPKTVDVEIEKRAKKEFNVDVDTINKDKMPDGYEVSDVKVDPEKVAIQSSKSVVDQIAVVKVFIDADGLKKPIKNREVPVNVYDSQGNKLNVSLDPEKVEVSADVDNPNKEISLKVKTSGDVPSGYSLESITPDKDKLHVYGTSDALDGFDEATTEDIDLSKIKKSGSIDAKLALPDGVKTEDGDDSVKVNVTLQQKKTIKNVPIDIKNDSNDQTISFVDPKKAEMDVTASGDEKDLRDLTADDIKISIDAGELDEGEHDVPIDVDEIKEVKLKPKSKQIKINVSNS